MRLPLTAVPLVLPWSAIVQLPSALRAMAAW
jgi:hypothetical protein